MTEILVRTTSSTNVRRIRFLPTEGVGTPNEQGRIGLSESAADGVRPLLQWLQTEGYSATEAQPQETKYGHCTDHEVVVRPPLIERHIGELATAFVDGGVVEDWGLDRVNPRYDGVVAINNVSTQPFDHIDTRDVIDSSLQRELYANDPSARLSA